MRSVPPVVFVSLLGLAACADPGSSAYVSANASLNAECAADESEFIAVGVWDPLPRNTDKSNCISSYGMTLVINSNLVANAYTAVGRAEPNALYLKYADVTLMDKSEATLAFRPVGNQELPNPYRVNTSGLIMPTSGDEPTTAYVEITAIPAVYADQIGQAFNGDSILVEIQVTGETTGSVPVDFPPFVYPLGICRNCYSMCRTDSRLADEAALTELNAGECDDNRPQDGRICVDYGC